MDPDAYAASCRPKEEQVNKRDTILALLALSAAPSAAVAQLKIHRLGWLAARSTTPALSDAFRGRLHELGYREGKNLLIEYRRSEKSADELDALAAELVQLKVDVIFASGGGLPVMAAKRATTTIPIVMSNVAFPVEIGIAASLARPSGNITGLSTSAGFMYGKRLELIKTINPRVAEVAILWQTNNPNAQMNVKQFQQAAEAIGIRVRSLEIQAPDDLPAVLAQMQGQRVQALLPINSPLISGQIKQVVNFAQQRRLPCVAADSRWPESGALMSYGPDFTDLYKRAALYVDKILKGAKAGDLPIEQPTNFELVINLKTAKALGLTIPQSLLLRADRLIE